MIARTSGFWALALLLACGGGGGGAPAGTPGKQAAAAAGEESEGGPPAAAKPATAAVNQPAAAALAGPDQSPGDSTQLQREVFSYRGADRDPFLSLMRSADVRPLVTDLRVSGITYDAAAPARSVAVLRDLDQNKRYTVRVGDELGRMKVTEIRADAVVVNLDEFGAERQVVLSVRKKQQEENP